MMVVKVTTRVIDMEESQYIMSSVQEKRIIAKKTYMIMSEKY